jgi:hypothetical protein
MDGDAPTEPDRDGSLGFVFGQPKIMRTWIAAGCAFAAFGEVEDSPSRTVRGISLPRALPQRSQGELQAIKDQGMPSSLGAGCHSTS